MKKIYILILSISLLFIFTACSGDESNTKNSLCDSNPCAESLIPHKIVCQEQDNDFTCICEIGYELKEDYCVKISNNTPCDNNPCKEENRGICTVIGDDYECNCNIGFYWDNQRCVEVLGTPCENYECSDEFSLCQVIDERASCVCYNGYEDTQYGCLYKCAADFTVNNANNGCIFDCSHIQDSVVNENNDSCVCEESFHIEENKCIKNIKGVNCKIDNPNKPLNADENSEEVDVEWEEDIQEWGLPAYCTWTCFEQYQGENCDECVDDYLMNDSDICIYDCSNDENAQANNDNNSCVCVSDYHIGNNGFCVETVNPCESNLCLTSGATTGKTNCIANTQEAGDFTCNCINGFEENEEGICIELREIHIRAVAGNVTSGSYQSYDYGHGIRILQGLKANVIMVQEFNYFGDSLNSGRDNTEDNYKEMVEAVFQDPNCLSDIPARCYYEVGTGNIIPNGVMSRFPIIEWGEWADPSGGVDSTRHLNWARLNIPGNKDLWVLSVHLSTDKPKRALAATAIIEGMAEIGIPSDAYIVIGGDFNTKSREEEVLVTLSERFYTAGPHPIGENGSTGTDAGRDDPYDWVLASPSLKPYQTSTIYCNANNANDCKIYTNGLIFDTRDFCPPDLDRDSCQSELDTYFSPTSFDDWTLQVNDSDSGSMQHMAVIKDFIISF